MEGISGRQSGKKLIEGLVDKDYIYQQFIEPPVMAMPSILLKIKYPRILAFRIGLYSYNHRLAGLYTRAGRLEQLSVI